jgi:hypothetical protein
MKCDVVMVSLDPSCALAELHEPLAVVLAFEFEAGTQHYWTLHHPCHQWLLVLLLLAEYCQFLDKSASELLGCGC